MTTNPTSNPTTVQVTTADGEMPAYLWLPESGSGPGLLLLQEIFGVSAYIRRRAADLAAAGYVVLAPELYWRLDQQEVEGSGPAAVEQAMSLVNRLDWPTTVADADEAFERLAGLDEVKGTPGPWGSASVADWRSRWRLMSRRPCWSAITGAHSRASSTSRRR